MFHIGDINIGFKIHMKIRPPAETAMLPGGSSREATISNAEAGRIGEDERSSKSRPPPCRIRIVTSRPISNTMNMITMIRNNFFMQNKIG